MKMKYNFNIKHDTKRIFLFLVTFLWIFVLMVTSVAPKKYDLSEGEIARSDIKAPREYVDEKASEEKLKQALESVDKQFTLKGEVKKQAQSNLTGLIEKVINVNSTSMQEAEKVSSLQKYDPIKLADGECKILISISKEKLTELEDNITKIIDSVYEKNIENDNKDRLSEARDDASKKINDLKLDSNLSSLLNKIVTAQIQPNFFYDEQKTEEKKKEVQKSTDKVLIKKNQIIVKEGEPVTARQIEILTDLGLLNENTGKGFALLYLVLAAFSGVILYIEHYYIYKNHKNIYSNLKMLALINLLNVVSLGLARVISIGSPYLIPLAWAPMLITLLVNYKVSMFVSTLNAVLIGTLVEFNPAIMILAVLNALLGATVLRKLQQRNDILYASVIILTLSGITSFTVGVILSSNITDIFLNTLMSVLGVFISGILAIGLLPFLEGAFDIVTTLKLLELSNPNSPLLKKLLMEAPGTYHHSVMVANLAEMAAEEVDADPVVTRIGSYYHDVGKTLRPYFFKENQIGKDNPHNKINASLSTLIIVSHVKEGLELAKEYKLPKVLQDIIAEHHGTTLVKYFYYTVKNNSEHPEEVREEDFRYKGPIPSSKESGLIMLADSTEAAVRSISDPTKGKIEEMVNNIIKDKLYTGQLDNCDLTLKDLNKIRKSFLKSLSGIYHQRIEYPTEKIKDLKK
ncbi:HDIG domain-containing protein [Clostridium sp. SHJSY1]|uniref:HD family phosphohydrolase n=1 Tax=Clostridium sp. SHJSY1 TaxID=2942483 RepID=UPI0028752525|nr:HDIG domain-containing metalloprotein [Clostridium sp. SHJSY1]MDS0524050.1 HDIG domain-containing protein [Clostridium sp. SHJSY1]